MGRSQVSRGLAFIFALLVGLPGLGAQSDDLSVASVKAALARQRAAVAARPDDLSAYIELAYTLSDAGMNDLAVEAMRKATAVAPKSSLAYNAQAWILRHNAVGVDFGKGFDYDAAVASYQRAIQLDPRNLDARESLANLYGYDRNGVEYGTGANLAGAIELYRYVAAHRLPVAPTLTENLSIALLYSGLYGEALAAIQDQPPTEKIDGVAIAATAALKGSKAAIELAASMSDPVQRRRNALETGAEGLWNMRLYSLAADLLSATLPNPDGQGVAAKIQLFRQLKPYRPDEIALDDPRRPVALLLRGLILGAVPCADGKLLVDGEDCATAVEGLDVVGAKLRVQMRRTGLPAAVLQDIVLGNLKLGTAGHGQSSALVNVNLVGQTVFSVLVLRQDGLYRMVGTGNDPEAAGMEALSLLRHGQEGEAKELLDWVRDVTPREQGEDPLGGSLFARVWTKGDSTGTDDIQRAVAALVTDQESLRSLLPSVASAAAKGDWGGFAQDTQALLLARIYLELKDTTKAKAASERLLASYPDSATALAMAGEAYRLSGDLKGWRDLLDSRLAKRPEDRALLLQRVDEAVAEGDFTAALDRCRKSLDSAHATSEDRNRCARLAVFAGKVDEEALAEAQSANLAEHKDNAAYLTTEAWINAELGNMAEARQLLLDAMDEAGLEEPSSDMWFAFGRMYEQYGVPAAAAAAYRRVKPAKKGAKEVRLDTTLLANARLKAMHMDGL